MDNPKLFLVTCVFKQEFNFEMEDMYVIAIDKKEAATKALNKMKELGWKYIDFVSNIECLAEASSSRSLLIL